MTGTSNVAVNPKRLDPADDQALAAAFNVCFGARYRVRCVGGYAEPEYLPATASGDFAQLRYTGDYAASALHEIAHWCVAGKDRLALADFGYGYLPPPRDPATQQRFFRLELKVQTVEAWFALGTGVRFVASADNLDCDQRQVQAFAQRISQGLEATHLQHLPPRAQGYTRALMRQGLGRWPARKTEARHD